MDNTKPLKILIAGYGKMGRLIAQLAPQKGHEIVAKVNSAKDTEWEWAMDSRPDVCIEFTQPDAAYDNIKRCLERGVPVVSGTTGWYAHLPEIRRLTARHHGALLYASNFSVGVNVMFKVNKMLAALMSHFPEYTCELKETHHIHKLDAPSGTAIHLAESLLGQHNSYTSWKLNADEEPGVLPVHAKRQGEVPGMHELTWQSPVDKISITHEAFNRQGFALGALMAAQWIVGKSGVFSMDDLFDGLLDQ